MAPVEVPRAKKTSAYFSFCKQHREQTKLRLKDAGKSISAPALTKALSELWRSLSDEEKQKYKDPCPCVSDALPPESSGEGDHEGCRADQACTTKVCSPDNNEGKGSAELSFSEHVQVTEHGDATGEKQCMADAVVHTDQVGVCEENVKDQDISLSESGGLVFPLARVKRIIKLDKEIRMVAADASNLIAHASQLFLEHLAMAAHASALKKKHKTIRIEDVKNAVKSEPRIDDFLAEALNDVLHHGKEDDSDSSDGADDAPEDVHAKGHVVKKSKISKKPLLELPAGTRKIADFFCTSNKIKAQM